MTHLGGFVPEVVVAERMRTRLKIKTSCLGILPEEGLFPILSLSCVFLVRLYIHFIPLSVLNQVPQGVAALLVRRKPKKWMP